MSTVLNIKEQYEIMQRMQDEFLLKETLRGVSLLFLTTYDLFSYKKIDEGTKLLIDTIEIEDGQTCLDLGCGYGAIGLIIAKLNPTGLVYMVDRDIVAVEYAKKNAEINKIKNVQVISSNGLQHVESIDFDVIASNLPTHIAKESLQQVISDAYTQLKANGKFYIVTTTKLKPFMQRLLEPVFGNCESIAQKNGYVILLTIKS